MPVVGAPVKFICGVPVTLNALDGDPTKTVPDALLSVIGVDPNAKVPAKLVIFKVSNEAIPESIVTVPVPDIPSKNAISLPDG